MGSDRKNRIVQYDGYVAAWLDGSIHDFLAVLPGNAESTAYALITCLDSNSDPASLLNGSADLGRALYGARPLKQGLLVPSKLLQKASLRKQLFVGFDEVWFFPHDDIEPRPAVASIIGPNRIDQPKLDALGPWMAENDCSLALGDGQGLNLVVKAHGLAKRVLAHSILQPEPAFQLDELWVQDEEKQAATAKPAKQRRAGAGRDKAGA
jgi:hypothetical protein